jgi:hypothetical protein
VTLLANGYALNTLGLTPFHMTLRLAATLLGVSACIGLLARSNSGRGAWPVRYVITVVVLAVCGGTLVTIGALNQSLDLAISEARRAAADWVAVDDVQVGFEMLQAMYRMPDRKIPYIQVTWDGSQQHVHTPADTIESVSVDRLSSAGPVVALTTMYLAHEKEY